MDKPLNDPNARFDVLFDAVPIGPVTAPNRFYQVPHCTGLGWLRPQMVAGLRAMKAEGGWGVVNTEYCSIHPTSDDLPYPYASLWDDGDVRVHALMTEQVHAHGALAGVELWHGGARSTNLYSRLVPIDVASVPNAAGDPYQTRAMDKADIRELRRWHRDAARRARQAGFDIVYVYATHGYLLANFLSPKVNRRTDEYGGSLENRARIVRELIEETREAVGDSCAVACRFSIDDGGGGDGVPVHGHGRDTFELLAELPDLWDLNVADYSWEMGVSRFVPQGGLEDYVAFAKSVTSKPVVSVGRFTSPDAMVSQIKRGVVDFIGAARPSIADPFLPKKIEEGRIEDIRECIGCNICVTGDHLSIPMMCTQNATMSEEWRRGWHPEKFAKKRADDRVLVVGAGPAGLEAVRVLGERGYEAVLAEATEELGGRVARECLLPGLSAWGRVRDYREYQLQQMVNVEVYPASELTVDDVLEFGAQHVAIATGAAWRRDGVGLTCRRPVAGLEEVTVATPDDIMKGRVEVAGPVVVWDDDNYYMGGVLAEKLRAEGHEVTLMTANADISSFTHNSLEQRRIQKQIMEMGIAILPLHALDRVETGEVVARCVYTARETRVACATLVPVTAMLPVDGLYRGLMARETDFADAGIQSVEPIGDAYAPSIIAVAVWQGHRYGREVGERRDNDVPAFKREINRIGQG